MLTIAPLCHLLADKKSQNSLLTVIQTGEKTENAHIGAFYLKNESAG